MKLPLMFGPRPASVRRGKRQERKEPVHLDGRGPRFARGNDRRQERSESAVRQRRPSGPDQGRRGALVGAVVGERGLEIERQAPSLRPQPADERPMDLDERRADARLTIAELREAATQAGISKEAFDAALEQVNAAGPSPPGSEPRWLSVLRSVVVWSGGVGGAIGVSSGVITRLLPFDSSAIAAAFGVATGATVYLAWRHREGRRVGWFAINAIVLWLYLLAGLVGGAGVPMSSLPALLPLVGGMAAASVALGAAIVNTPPAMDDDSGEAPSAARK
jgi:hypothetical protein